MIKYESMKFYDGGNSEMKMNVVSARKEEWFDNTSIS